MLDTYRNDQRIWHIGGYNLQDKHIRGDADYYFSQETSIWGWATWRRVWKHYNLTLETLETFEKSSLRPYLKSTRLHSFTALYDFKKVTAGKINTWDYQYSYYQLVNFGLSVVPNVNLIENIGFDSDATHVNKQKDIFIANKSREADYTEIKHPVFFVPEVAADKYTYNKRTSFLKKIYVFVWYYFIYRVRDKSK